MGVKENLIAARALIDTPEKWAQHEFSPAPDCFCALGAIAASINEDPDSGIWFQGSPASAMERRLKMELPAPFFDVPDFNDHPDTTHADVMAVFDRAIAACEVAA